MTKVSVRVLLLSCVMASAFIGPVVHAQTTPVTNMQTSAVPYAGGVPANNINAINSANAAAAYTGNPALAQQAGQPGQVMMPSGMPMGPFQQQEQQQVEMRYDKRKAEGAFYGVELPQRLFNNVPSDW